MKKTKTTKVVKTTKKIDYTKNKGLEHLDNLIEKAKAKDLYNVSIYFNNTEYTSQVEDVFTYLMEIKPFLLKTKVILKIEKNGKKTEKMFIPKIARRLWMLPTAFKAVITRLNYK